MTPTPDLITTADGLNGLPPMSAVVDAKGYVWQADEHLPRMWWCAGTGILASTRDLPADGTAPPLLERGPVRVIYIPTVAESLS